MKVRLFMNPRKQGIDTNNKPQRKQYFSLHHSKARDVDMFWFTDVMREIVRVRNYCIVDRL